MTATSQLHSRERRPATACGPGEGLHHQRLAVAGAVAVAIAPLRPFQLWEYEPEAKWGRHCRDPASDNVERQEKCFVE